MPLQTCRRFNMDFSDALRKVKAGNKIARKDWNGKGMWIACEPVAGKVTNHDVTAKISHPLLLIKNSNGTFATWVPSTTDIFAEDWEVL